MELRHLRYFVAVAEEGSLSTAALKRLHVAQPSLTRQMRDLEQEVGTLLFNRTTRGIELTEAGTAFLEQARLALAHAGEAIAAARRASRPAKQVFTIGFLTGQEVEWLPQITRVLRTALVNTEFRTTSDYSTEIAKAVQDGEIDIGFSRVEAFPDVTYKIIAYEPIVVLMPSDHPLAEKSEIDPCDLQSTTFIGYEETTNVLRRVVDAYLSDKGVSVSPVNYLDNIATGISMVGLTGGVTLLPKYAEPLMPWSVVSRPLKGEQPIIEIAVGYRADNPSPVLKYFLENIYRVTAL